jgi:hypothetical protein
MWNRRRFMRVGAGLGVAGLATRALPLLDAASPGEQASEDGEILRFQARNATDQAGRRNAYYTFALTDFAIEPGDVLEYDIRIKGDSPDLVGSIDMEFDRGASLRSMGVVDQDGVSSHPAAPLGEKARDQGFHRILPLEKCAGHTIQSCQIALATDCAVPGVYTVYFANARITRGGETRTWLYRRGEPEGALVDSRNLTDFALVRVRPGELDAPLPPPPLPAITALSYARISEPGQGFVDSPRLGTGPDNRAWAVWVNHRPNGLDSVCLAGSTTGPESTPAWGPVRELTPRDGAYETPTLSVHPRTGQVLVLWVCNQGEDWRLESVLPESRERTVQLVAPPDQGRVAHPVLTPDREAGFWAAWENYANGRFTIRIAHWTAGRWEEAITLETGPGNAYHPALAVDSAGRPWISYCRPEAGERHLYVTALGTDGRTTQAPRPVCRAGRRTYQCGRSSLVFDAEERLWIAWEHIHPGKRRDAYFGMCECHVACLQDGRLFAVVPEGQRHRGVAPLRSANHQQPELRVDADGRLWLLSRASRQERRAWTITASLLDGERGWTHPVDLLPGQPLGRRGPAAVGLSADGLVHAVWQGDNVLAGKPLSEIRGPLYAARGRLPAPAPEGPPVRLSPIEPRAETGSVPYRHHTPRRTVEVDGEHYTLLFGNLHEHSIISRCWSDCSDGDLHDNYRYGMDVEGYDFVAMTDHGYDLYEAAWRQTRRAARFHTQGEHFIGLAAYEWTRSGEDRPEGSGHRNVVFASDEDAARILLDSGNVAHKDSPETDRPEKLWAFLRERGITAVTIPHHTADKQHPMDWDSHDAEYQCVVEIFQCRQSCEHAGCPRETPNKTSHPGCYVQDALQRGYRFGFVASGDHNSMGDGVAAVLVREVSQAGIVEALRARRCYATTGDHMFIDFRVNDHCMGTAISGEGPASLSLEAEGTAPITDVVIFRNTEPFVHLTADDLRDTGTSLKLQYTDDGQRDTEAWYYARVIQENNQIAWSSPIWLSRPAT